MLAWEHISYYTVLTVVIITQLDCYYQAHSWSGLIHWKWARSYYFSNIPCFVIIQNFMFMSHEFVCGLKHFIFRTQCHSMEGFLSRFMWIINWNLLYNFLNFWVFFSISLQTLLQEKQKQKTDPVNTPWTGLQAPQKCLISC